MQKTKRLVIGYSILVDPQFRVMCEEAEREISAGNDVVFAYCDGACDCCYRNPIGSKLQCWICRTLSHFYERRFYGRARVVRVGKIEIHKNKFQYESIAEFKKITYLGVNVGYGAYSLYVTLTRDIVSEITEDKRNFLDFLLSRACAYADMASTLIENERPDAVSVYNGRLIETRPFYELSILRGIPVRVNEVVLDESDPERECYKLFNFENSFPQDIERNYELINKLWETPDRSVEEKTAIAEDFFVKRRNGKPTIDTFNPGAATSYIQKQSKGVLPSDFDYNKKNIVIFNSSEDEYVSIDPKFESYALFLSQYEGVRAVAEALLDRPDYHIYLRVHPHLSTIKYSYHTDLYKLAEIYKNLTVIAATDKCSTYDLMQAADKVVVFGSTMGAESTYWGKSTILIGTALYYLTDIAYKPKNVEELKSLLTSDLLPKGKEDALKYGYYLCSRTELASPAMHIDMGFRTHWRSGRVPAWPCFLGSYYISAQLRSFIGKHKKWFSNVRLPQSMCSN